MWNLVYFFILFDDFFCDVLWWWLIYIGCVMQGSVGKDEVGFVLLRLGKKLKDLFTNGKRV